LGADVERVWACYLPGEPQRKRAHRAATNHRTKYPEIIDPDRELKNDLAQYIATVCGLPPAVLSGPLEVLFQFRFEVPASCSKKEAARRITAGWAQEVPKDCDNMVKLYQDVLQTGMCKGKIFSDDHFVCRVVTEKIYSRAAGVYIEIRKLSALDLF
jgi:Holliday junction resolvase RusA-like endonuclease